MRSITKFELFLLSKYLVETGLVGLDKQEFIESTISVRRLLCIEWYKKLGSQILFLILKSPVIINILLMFASVSFRYFKAVCDESK